MTTTSHADKSQPRPPRSKGRVTLADIARMANTSAITVSRVLNQPKQVSTTLRERVLAAVRDTGYVPNRAAQSLAGTRNYTIAVIIPSLSNAVFSDVVRGLYDVCNPAGFELLMGNSYYSVQQEAALFDKFIQQQPDGLIIAGTGVETSRITNIPIVKIMDVDDARPSELCVGLSHHAAGCAMAEYFLQQGYHAPGLIAAQLDNRTQRRIAGFLETLHAAGVSKKRVVTSPQPSSVRLGGELLNDLLAVQPETNAVFCTNDDLAWGALFECQRRHLRVPNQLAISGFNDLEPSACFNPALTTIATPLYDIGATAARLLLQQLDGKMLDKPVQDLGFRLCRRASA